MTPNRPEPDQDDLLFFAEEAPEGENRTEHAEAWRILIVDDDHEIHAVTQLALSGLMILDRGLQFLHAYSAEEARDMLRQERNIAVALLDVVMETDDAGLRLVEFIRNELGDSDIRLILRTGQPGYAPEERVIKEFDINDYKTKTELTRNRLVTSVITAIRSYHQLIMLDQSRRGLEKIIQSSANLMEHQAMAAFAEGVLTQLAAVIGLRPEGLLCARRGHPSQEGEDPPGVYVLGAAGRYAHFINQTVDALPDRHIQDVVNRCLSQRSHLFTDKETVLYINSSGNDAAIYVDSARPMEQFDRSLLEVFLTNIGVGYTNINLFQRLQRAAYLDELTHLANRTDFIRQLDLFGEQGDSNGVVAIVDINHFSDINDGLGQEVGNLALRAVAERLVASLGAETLVARVGSDVFGVTGDAAVVTPERLLAAFNLPFIAGEHSLQLRATLGLCHQEQARGRRGLDILKQVFIALNLAKKDNSQRFAFYESRFEDSTRSRLETIRWLRQDFSERKLQVWYQPQIDLRTGKVSGMEALLRWPDGKGGFTSPAVFIPLAEYSGLIIDIGAWVLEQSCRDLIALRPRHPDLRVSVNVSMQQFRSPDFLDTVNQIVSRLQMPSGALELEITESVVMDDPKVVIAILGKLREAGMSVAIDDFGTGFSSLGYLQQLPVDRVKIDRSFISIVDTIGEAVIAEMVVSLAQRLQLETICEGVETEAQVEYLRKIGCDGIQGFLYARPMPIGQLQEYLAQRNS
ncbi:MAG: EAL domain-containing protein [Gammaproteobacteria bacterium]|nr:EAL domain-containing protein [Gammaproteobacteria bacterium]